MENRISKERLQTVLKEDRELAQHSIPSQRIADFKDFLAFLKKHHKVVVKPVRGRRGRGVHIIERKGRKYIVGIQKSEQILSRRQLRKFYYEHFNKKPHVVQKAISSRLKNGDPFDCRIHLEKNGKGEWAIIKIIARIGIGQKVIANVNYGGGRSEIEPFLEANFPDRWKSIHKNLMELGLNLAHKIEEVRGNKLMTLGLDVGIEPSGNLYVFEANTGPGTDVIKSEVALTRTLYYKYRLKKINNNE